MAVILLSLPSISFAQETVSASLNVSAAVPAHTYLITDQAGNISSIFCNANFAADPVALLGNIDGRQTALSPEILKQYEKLRPTLVFHSGYIYRRPSPVSQSIKSSFKMSLFRPALF